MDDAKDNNEFPRSLGDRQEPVATNDDLAGRSPYVSKEEPRASGKVKELGIFTVGIGVILAALTIWLSFALQPSPGERGAIVLAAVPLAISAIYVVLGILTLLLKSRVIVKTTIVVVALGYILDLVISFNIVRAGIVAAIVWLIVKTGREALREVGFARPNDDGLSKVASEFPVGKRLGLPLPTGARAAIYGVAWLPFLVLVTFFVPKYAGLFDDSRRTAELPAVTECVLWFSSLNSALFPLPCLLVLALLIAADVGVARWLRRCRRGWLLYRVWSVGVVVAGVVAAATVVAAPLLGIIKMGDSL